MEKILKAAHDWMDRYIKSFYFDDETIMLGIRTKEIHTGYVTANARELAIHLGLSKHQVQMAELMGLLHDVGRFRQWQIYQTFSDAASEDHADLGVKTIVTLPFYDMLGQRDKNLLLFAIQNHNKKAIAPHPDEEALGFAKLLRDADKLDIYRVLAPYMNAENAKKKGKFFKEFIDVTDTESFAPGFVEKFINGEQVDYNEIKTYNDRKLVRLMWVYDVNFAWTLQRIKDRGYIDAIIGDLPHTLDTEKGFTRLNNYVAERCSQDDEGFPEIV